MDGVEPGFEGPIGHRVVAPEGTADDLVEYGLRVRWEPSHVELEGDVYSLPPEGGHAEVAFAGSVCADRGGRLTGCPGPT